MMTPVLLAPLGLAALAAVLVPLLIHLRRRTEEIPVDFAAMRWLEAMPRPRRKLRLDELLLLILRLLLVILLALLLARPALRGDAEAQEHFLVAPGADPTEAKRIAGVGAELRWIAPGFPSIDETPVSRGLQLSSLIRQYDAELDTGIDLMLLVPPVIDGVDAERLRLTRQVGWRIVESDAKLPAPKPVATPKLVVRYAAGRDEAVRYFRAAAAAWSNAPRFDAAPVSELPPLDHVLVWLVPGPVPPAVTEWTNRGGTALLANTAEVAMPGTAKPVWRDERGNTLVEATEFGSGRLMRFMKPLTPASMPELLEASFATRLRDLAALEAPPPARAAADTFEPDTGSESFPLPPREQTPWFALTIALVLLFERLLATHRRRFLT